MALLEIIIAALYPPPWATVVFEKFDWAAPVNAPASIVAVEDWSCVAATTVVPCTDDGVELPIAVASIAPPFISTSPVLLTVNSPALV